MKISQTLNAHLGQKRLVVNMRNPPQSLLETVKSFNAKRNPQGQESKYKLSVNELREMLHKEEHDND